VLTDNDKTLLERWTIMQLQQKLGVTSHPSLSASTSQITTTLNVVTTTTMNTTTTITTTGMLQLCSVDSRLADRCLAVNAELVWTPSVSLSSADINRCLQPAQTSATSSPPPPPADDDDDEAMVGCCAGYGIGDVLPPLSDMYVD